MYFKMEIFETIFLLLFHPKMSFLYGSYFLALLDHFLADLAFIVLPLTLLFISVKQFFFNFKTHFYTRMFNSDDITNENNKDHNKKWGYVPDRPY